MPQLSIPPLTKEEALAIARCFVETNQEEICNIVARYLERGGGRRYNTPEEENTARNAITVEELARVRHFAKHISHLHTDTLFYKWYSPAKKEIKTYLENKLAGDLSGGGHNHFEYRNGSVLYRHLFLNNKDILADTTDTHSARQHPYALFFVYSEDKGRLSALAGQGFLPAMHKRIKDANANFPFIKHLIWFGFDCAIDVFSTAVYAYQVDGVSCHQALKMTRNPRVVEMAERFLLEGFQHIDVNNTGWVFAFRAHHSIIRFFGHACEKNIKKASSESFNNVSLIDTVANDVDPLVTGHYPLIDDPVEFLKFILIKEASWQGDKKNITRILHHINLVDFVTQAPLCWLTTEWLEVVFGILREKVKIMNEALERGVDSSVAEIIKVEQAIHELEAYNSQESEFYKRRLSIFQGRTHVLLQAFLNEHPKEQEQLKTLREHLLTNNFEDYYKKDDSEPLRALKEECLSLQVLHPEHVRLQPHSRSLCPLPASISYAPPSASTMDLWVTSPIDWVNNILNANHEDMYRLSERLGNKVVGRLSKEDQGNVRYFNFCLGLVLSEIKENTLTRDERREITQQIATYKKLPEPFCKNAEFLEAALNYVPRGSKEEMPTLLVGHAYCETLFLAANIDDPTMCSIKTANEHLAHASLWRDPIAFAAFVKLETLSYDRFIFAEKIRYMPAGLVSASSDRFFSTLDLGKSNNEIFAKSPIHWYLANKDFKPARDILERTYRAGEYSSGRYCYDSALSMILNCVCEYEQWTSDIPALNPSTNFKDLVKLLLEELKPGLPYFQRKIVDWRGKNKEVLVHCALPYAKPIEALFIQGYFALKLPGPEKVLEAITHLLKIPLIYFTPQQAYLIALEIKKIYFDVFIDSIHCTDRLYYSGILGQTLSLLDIVWFPKLFVQDESFFAGAAEELHRQLEEKCGSIPSDTSTAKRIRERRVEINDYVSGAQLSFIDLFPVDLLEADERHLLSAMRAEAETGHLFLSETEVHPAHSEPHLEPSAESPSSYPFHSKAGVDLLNNLLLLSGEKKKVEIKPVVAVEASSATHAVVVSGDSGGGGGEARATVTTRSEIGVTSLNAGAVDQDGFFSFSRGKKKQTLVSSATTIAEIDDAAFSQKFGAGLSRSTSTGQ